jgi:hypothetical protein
VLLLEEFDPIFLVRDDIAFKSTETLEQYLPFQPADLIASGKGIKFENWPRG